MDRTQFERAKAAILADANGQGEYFGPHEGESCAVGGLYIAANPGHSWEYYLDMSEDMVGQLVEETYGLTEEDQEELIAINDINSDLIQRHALLIAELERLLAYYGE